MGEAGFQEGWSLQRQEGSKGREKGTSKVRAESDNRGSFCSLALQEAPFKQQVHRDLGKIPPNYWLLWPVPPPPP